MHPRTVLVLLLTAVAAPGQQATRERGRFSLQGDPATRMALDAPVKTALIAFSTGGVCVFPTDQRVVSVFVHPIHKKAVTGAVFSLDGKTFFTASADGTLKKWDTEAALKHRKALEDTSGDGKPDVPKPVQTAAAHTSGVACLAISPDGERLATGGADGSVKLWDGDTLKPAAVLTGAHPGGVRAVAFSPDGKLLASGGADRTARLWDVEPVKPTTVRKLEKHEGPVNAVAFSPDGTHLATGTGVAKKAGAIHVWEVETGKPAYKLEGHEDVVTCLLFHPKTKHLASGGADKMIRVWDLDGKVQQYADEHADPVHNMVISPDGTRLGSCSNHSVRWWAGFGK